MSIEQDRQDREDRVMGALDVATKPIQAAQGMFLIIKAIVIALVLLLGLPIYLLVTGQPIAFWQIEAFFLTLMLIGTFCYTCLLYTSRCV